MAVTPVVAKVVVVIRSLLRVLVGILEVVETPVVVEPTLEVERIRLRVLAKVLEARVMAMDLGRALVRA